MALLLPQSNSPEAAWITVAEAAARSGLPERTIRHNCRRWSAMGKADKRTGEWLISPLADDRFLATVDDDQRAEVLDIMSVSGNKRSVANVRRTILTDLEAYISARVRDGRGRVDAIQEFARRFGGRDGDAAAYPVRFGWRTLYGWARRNADAPASGLVDRRGLSGECREPDLPLKALFERRWLNSQQLSLQTVFRELVMFADRERLWCWGSYTTFRRWVHATYPKAMQCLNREGLDKYRQNHEPSRHQDPDAYAAGEMYVGDHHQFRAMVRYRGRIIRPWLTAWLDQRSLAFTGWVVVPSPNQLAILSAYKHAITRFGVSGKALMDNGRDYSGYALTGGTSWRAGLVLNAGYLDTDQVGGLFGLIGTEAIFAQPHSPNSKIIEGRFKVVEESFVRSLPNYCGADPDDRPHDFAARPESSFPTLEEFAAVVGTWLDDVYNRTPWQGEYCAGISPLEVFAQKRASESRFADPAVLDLLDMQWTRPIKVTRKGVRVNNLFYGEWHPQIIALHGEHVRATYNPNDIGSVGIWTLDHRFICRADQGALYNRNATDEDRREGFRLRAQLKKAMRVVQDKSHLAFGGAADFALAAQRDHVERTAAAALVSEPAPALPAPNLRLVQTPIDGQMDQVRTAFDSTPAALPADVTLEDAATGMDDLVGGDLDDCADVLVDDIDLADLEID
jgi:hypothetical protein